VQLWQELVQLWQLVRHDSQCVSQQRLSQQRLSQQRSLQHSWQRLNRLVIRQRGWQQLGWHGSQHGAGQATRWQRLTGTSSQVVQGIRRVTQHGTISVTQHGTFT
jgi:hypothetical protein